MNLINEKEVRSKYFEKVKSFLHVFVNKSLALKK